MHPHQGAAAVGRRARHREPRGRVGHRCLGQTRLGAGRRLRRSHRRQAGQGSHRPGRDARDRGHQGRRHAGRRAGRGGRVRRRDPSCRGTQRRDRDGLGAQAPARRRDRPAHHHQRSSALVRPDPRVGRGDRRRRRRPGVRVAVPLVRSGRHAAGGAPGPGTAGGRGGLEGDRASVPQARHHDGERRVRRDDRRHGLGGRGHATRPGTRPRR